MTTACRTTQHCAVHGFCHRCTPSLDDAVRHLVKAISAAGIADEHKGAVYEQLAATVRDAARTAAVRACTCPHQADEHSVYGCADDCACEWMPKRAARQATGQDDTGPAPWTADGRHGPTPGEMRQAIARAIHRYDSQHALSGNDIPSEHHYGEADAVVSVLAAFTVTDHRLNPDWHQRPGGRDICPNC